MAAQLRRRQFATLLEHSPQAIVILDADGLIREWNPAAERMFGWVRADVLGGDIDRLVPVEGRADSARLWASLAAGGRIAPFESSMLNRDGVALPVRLHLASIKSARGHFGGVVATLLHAHAPVVDAAGSSTTGAQLLIGRLECDELTGLPGRRWLQRRMSDPVPTGRVRGLVVFDLDGFALVNQDFGPDAADEVLRALTGRLALLVGDGVLGRWQADELVCLIDLDEAADPSAALTGLAELLAEAAREPFLVGADVVHLTVSGGLVTSATVPVSEMFRSATAAMYAAKTGGRDRNVWFRAAEHTVVVGGLRLSHDLHSGIRNGELRLHFQPIVALDTYAVVGVEALVRWERPGVGLLSPSSFIDVAERSGQIVPLGAWVAKEGCVAARDLVDAGGAPLTVSINISARQLNDPGLVEMLAASMAETGCPPSQLVVEVTETALLQDMRAATAVLEDITALGMALDLDDFGTGYSSLLYLKYFPVDRIKIDRSFVSGLGTDAADTAIVASTIALAHSVGLKAVAEGVETAEQFELLSSMECDFAQGYYLTPPLPMPQLQDWLHHHAPKPRARPEAWGTGLGVEQTVSTQRRALDDERDEQGTERDLAADRRDEAGADRDRVADRRDKISDARDDAGDARDRVGDARDEVGDQRDRWADNRDRDADAREAQLGLDGAVSPLPGPRPRPDLAARRNASADRTLAAQDRGAEAGVRQHAERERDEATADRDVGAEGRLNAKRVRERSGTIRAAAAQERLDAFLDEIPGGHAQADGMLALQGLVDTAVRDSRALAVGCIDIVSADPNHDGRADRALMAVASALAATLRAADVMVLTAPNRFVCGYPRRAVGTVEKRLSVIQVALAGSGVTVEVGVTDLRPGDSLDDLVARAGATPR